MPDTSKAVLLNFESPITWRIPLVSHELSLGAIRGCTLLSPLCLQQARSPVGPVLGPGLGHKKGWARFPNDDEIVFSAYEMLISVPGIDYEKEMRLAAWLAPAFLCWCRILCSQHSINREPNPSIIAPAKWDQTIPLELPVPPSTPEATGCTASFETAITPDIASQAIELLKQDILAPSHLHHFISAIDSIMANDYQSGYVLAATAVESFVSTTLHRLYEQKKHDPNVPSMRFVTIKVNKSQTVRKDPIWDYLNEGRPDFKLLLHEKPLYLGLPSVLINNQTLYDRARRLYKTRNDLVHEGAWSRDHDTYLPNRLDGVDALECAAEVMKMFGAPAMRVPKARPEITKFKTATFKLRHLEETRN